MKLNLGCGSRKLEGYTGVDLAPGAEIQCDIRKLTFAENESVDEIIAIHVIEHFYRWEVLPMLMDWRRVLVKGGKLILECPNIKKAASALLAGSDDNMSMWAFYGNPELKDELHCHHWGYTPETLTQAVKSAGFKDCKILPAQFKIPQRDMRLEAYR